MIGIIAFATLQFLVSGYACWRGGAPERTVGLLLAAALIATMLTPFQPSYTYAELNLPLVRVDLLLFATLGVVALLADRFWPMWLAALQMLAIGTHGVRMYESNIVPVAYWALTSRIGYLMVLLLAVGTARHQSRVGAGMPEHGWTWQRLRDGTSAS